MSANFCRDCGTKISGGVEFCPGCGRKIHTSNGFAGAKVAVISSGQNCNLKYLWANSGPLQKLFALIWLSIVVSAVSVVVDCYNVKEYYCWGRAWHFWFDVAFLGLDIWLAMSITHLKSWARKSFVAMAGLSVLGTLGGETTFLWIMSLVLTLYCAYLCFCGEVVLAFMPDAQVGESRAIANRHHCIAFWSLFAMVSVFMVIFGSLHRGTSAWGDDCSAAIFEGSSSAREDMIDFVAELYAAQGVEFPLEQATEYVDSCIRDNERQMVSNLRNGDFDDLLKASREYLGEFPKNAKKNAGAFSKLILFLQRLAKVKFWKAFIFVGGLLAGIFSWFGEFISKRKKG